MKPYVDSSATPDDLVKKVNIAIEVAYLERFQIADGKSTIQFKNGAWRVVLVWLFKGTKARREKMDWSQESAEYDYRKLFDNAGWAIPVLGPDQAWYFFGTKDASKA